MNNRHLVQYLQNTARHDMYKSTVCNPKLVCGSSIFDMEFSTTGIGYPTDSFLKNNLQCRFIFKDKTTTDNMQ